MDIKNEFNNYAVNCDIKIKDEPLDESTELDDITKICIKTEYTSENEDESDSDNGNLVIKQEFEEKSDDYSISNIEIKLEDIQFSNQERERERGTITHNIEGIFQCDTCSFTTPDKTSLPIHKKTHRISIQGCNMCFYICGSALKLKYHKRKKHMKDEDLRHYCKDCSFSTLVSAHLKKHRKENHKKILKNARSKCQVCSYRGNVSNLKKHKEQFHQELALCSEAI